MPSSPAARSSSRTSAAKRSDASISGPGAGHADLLGQPDERRVVGQQLALGVVGAQEALLHLALQPVLGRELEEAVAVEGVAAAGEVEAHVEPVAGRHVAQLLLPRARLLDAHPVLLGQVLGARPRARRRARVELERAPA